MPREPVVRLLRVQRPSAATLLALGRRSAALNMTEGNAALREVIRRELKRDAVAGENADVVLAHLAVGVSDEFVTVVELHSVAGVREHFQDLTRHLNEIFLCHMNPCVWGNVNPGILRLNLPLRKP